MTYMTLPERQSFQKGLEQGLAQLEQGQREALLAALEILLEVRFGSESAALLPDLARVREIECLRTIRDRIRRGSSLDEIRLLVAEALQHDDT